MSESTQQELRDAIDAIEEMYEFTLAYAGQGVSAGQAGKAGGEVRSFLQRADGALERVADLFDAVVREESLSPVDSYAAFVDVLRDDARKSRAAVRLTLDQPGISSQLVDNLNASIHVRALLTDIFLLDEIMATLAKASAPTG